MSIMALGQLQSRKPDFRSILRTSSHRFTYQKLDLSHSLDRNNSIQNEARIKRYEWFDEMMNVLEADVLLTAHHLDDQLETIMYRIFNGKSTRNKLGFDELSKRKGYQIYRPLLAVSKKK